MVPYKLLFKWPTFLKVGSDWFKMCVILNPVSRFLHSTALAYWEFSPSWLIHRSWQALMEDKSLSSDQPTLISGLLCNQSNWFILALTTVVSSIILRAPSLPSHYVFHLKEENAIAKPKRKSFCVAAGSRKWISDPDSHGGHRNSICSGSFGQYGLLES